MEQVRPEESITYFAQTDSRDKKIPFGIKAKDRTRHVYIIGKTGMGKSTVLENMAVQDITSGNGLAFIDPHGKTADLLLQYIPEERIKDVLFFAPFDVDYPISFNVLEDVGADKRHLVVNGLMSAFKKIWVDAWSARMEYILNNILLALLEYPGSTLIGVNRMLADKEYRKRVVENVKDPAVKAFWVDEFAKYGERYMQEAGAAIQNKIGQFISNPLVRNIIGQPRSSFDIRKMMDEKKILIINLSKGRVGEQNANLLGSMLITKIYLAALSRADVPERVLNTLPNFYLYVDEFQSFANESFADILSEARKYKLNLTIAHQYIEQMSDEVRAAVFGNVGTMVVFRVGAYDAEVLEKEFAPVFTAEDVVNLGVFQIYLKLMINGVSSQPFSATTLPPIRLPSVSYVDKIIEESRTAFALPRATVEEEVRRQAGVDKLSDVLKVDPGKIAPPRRIEGPAGDVSHAKPRENRASDNRGERRERKPEREAPPPEDDGEGFTSLKDIAGGLRPRGERQGGALRSPQQQPQPQQKKAGTGEHLSSLRAALASVVGSAPAAKPAEEKPVEPKPAAAPQKPPEPAPKERLSAPASQNASAASKDAVSPPKQEPVKSSEEPKAGRGQQSEKREVPEDVLRKILDAGDLSPQ